MRLGGLQWLLAASAAQRVVRRGEGTMQRQRTTWHGVAAPAVLLGCGLGIFAGAAHDKDDAPRPLPPEVVKAWRDAGAEVGWMKDGPPGPLDKRFWGYWDPFRKKGGAGAVPAFDFHPREGVLAKLPDPGVAFGLDARCGLMEEAVLKELARFKSLQSLNLGGVRDLTDARMKEVARLENLQGLYLFATLVGDPGLKELARLKNLRTLDLSDTRVTDAGLKELAGLKSLQTLNLVGTGVTDAGLRELARVKSLRWLDVDVADVTAQGVAALRKALPKCRIIFRED
jgi:hypothetical protein